MRTSMFSSLTYFLTAISPSSACYSETVNTLRFGQRAKQIVNRPVVNEDAKEKLIRELRTEIARLKELLTLQVLCILFYFVSPIIYRCTLLIAKN